MKFWGTAILPWKGSKLSSFNLRIPIENTSQTVFCVTEMEGSAPEAPIFSDGSQAHSQGVNENQEDVRQKTNIFVYFTISLTNWNVDFKFDPMLDDILSMNAETCNQFQILSHVFRCIVQFCLDLDQRISSILHL